MAAANASLGVDALPPEDELMKDVDTIFKNARQAQTGSLNGFTQSYILPYGIDNYDGVIIDPTGLPEDVPTFVVQLQASLAYWNAQQRKGVWLKLPLPSANLVLSAIQAGFTYHHAEPTYLMLTRWLPETPSTLPPNASHQVGVAAFVLNEKSEVLAVQEKNGPLRGSGIWKMPTGLVNQGEDIFAGAVREVKEETGVDTEFMQILGFRQGHQVAFDKSDLFFVCILKPCSSEIVKQDSEIEAAKWMPLVKFKAQPFFQERSMLKRMMDICIASTEGHYQGFSPNELNTGFQKQNSYFYQGPVH
ncbi:hypothetical protein O6H91_07G034400 [Diphasiastrum complanatum]|uniref:Uncharacterized protein n=2 Tax=Diphasiastrum complanatum TaxID=34168 RepID=A0ACC2D3Z5_DIPCM|nr:hypothetical protein O6H91_07G034400 [Diphasiastrum complanatum]KAJ7548954.1 hypothetical protein O6H91_07G034400 [Diphasiastrum complanatum]